jgi:glycosyltransferase involved in cell wall biosynthesis
MALSHILSTSRRSPTSAGTVAPPAVVMLYSSDWTHELRQYRCGEVPSHRLFGFADLERLGYQVRLFVTPPWLRRLRPSANIWRICQALWVALRQRRCACVVATTESPALPVLMLKAIGLIRTPVIVVSVALLHDKYDAGLRRALWSRCVIHADAVLVYAASQASIIRSRFSLPSDMVVPVPLGVDTEFFTPETGDDREPDMGRFVLSVGTNEGKDFATLMRAMPPGRALRVVTDAGNAEVIARSGRPDVPVTVESAVPIIRLRELYRAAPVHVIPLREAQTSSGQTVLLENMALGRAVIVSDVSGIRDYVEPGVTAIVVPPGEVVALRKAIEAAFEDPAATARIGRAAAEAVRRRYSARHFAARLSGLITAVSTPAPGRQVTS